MIGTAFMHVTRFVGRGVITKPLANSEAWLATPCPSAQILVADKAVMAVLNIRLEVRISSLQRADKASTP